jgi:hypothetical protein
MWTWFHGDVPALELLVQNGWGNGMENKFT